MAPQAPAITGFVEQLLTGRRGRERRLLPASSRAAGVRATSPAGPLWLCFATSRDARAARIRRPLAAVAVPGGRCNRPASLVDPGGGGVMSLWRARCLGAWVPGGAADSSGGCTGGPGLRGPDG